MGNGSHFDSDDALYLEMSRQMVQTGDWVDNQWCQTVLFEKPPLYIWSLAISGAVFGWDEAPMRLPGVLFAALALVSLVALGRGLGLGVAQALGAAGLMAGSYFFVLMTRRVMMDIPLLACLLAAAACLVRARIWAFGLFCGLAVMAKGPGAAPLILALVVFGLADHRRLRLRELSIAAGAGLLVAAPWHLLQTVRHGAAFWEGYVGYHVGERLTGHVVPGLSLVETFEVLSRERLLLLAGLVGLGVAIARRLRSSLDRFAAIWLGLALLPVLASTTRLPHYLLPTVPALALLAVAAPRPAWWSHRLAPLLAAAAALLAFAAHPAKLVFWLDADFGPVEKTLGAQLREHAHGGDLVATYNSMNGILLFYSGAARVDMWVDDPRFYAVQDAVLMVRRSAVLHRLDRTGFPKAPTPGGRRFVVARAEPDLPRLVSRMRQAEPRRPLYVLAVPPLVLVNDAGLGEPTPIRER